MSHFSPSYLQSYESQSSNSSKDPYIDLQYEFMKPLQYLHTVDFLIPGNLYYTENIDPNDTLKIIKRDLLRRIKHNELTTIFDENIDQIPEDSQLKDIHPDLAHFLQNPHAYRFISIKNNGKKVQFDGESVKYRNLGLYYPTLKLCKVEREDQVFEQRLIHIRNAINPDEDLTDAFLRHNELAYKTLNKMYMAYNQTRSDPASLNLDPIRLFQREIFTHCCQFLTKTRVTDEISAPLCLKDVTKEEMPELGKETAAYNAPESEISEEQRRSENLVCRSYANFKFYNSPILESQPTRNGGMISGTVIDTFRDLCYTCPKIDADKVDSFKLNNPISTVDLKILVCYDENTIHTVYSGETIEPPRHNAFQTNNVQFVCLSNIDPTCTTLELITKCLEEILPESDTKKFTKEMSANFVLKPVAADEYFVNEDKVMIANYKFFYDIWVANFKQPRSQLPCLYLKPLQEILAQYGPYEGFAKTEFMDNDFDNFVGLRQNNEFSKTDVSKRQLVMGEISNKFIIHC